MLTMTKKSIFYVLVFIFITGISLTTLSVKADNPSGMGLTYHSSTKVVDVRITHNVGDDPNYYIKSVTIKVNASIVKSETYTSQPNSGTFTYQYDNITANFGATSEATAICSIVGSATRSIILGGGSIVADGDPIIPGYIDFLLIIVASVVIIIPLIYKKTKRVIK